MARESVAVPQSFCLRLTITIAGLNCNSILFSYNNSTYMFIYPCSVCFAKKWEQNKEFERNWSWSLNPEAWGIIFGASTTGVLERAPKSPKRTYKTTWSRDWIAVLITNRNLKMRWLERAALVLDGSSGTRAVHNSGHTQWALGSWCGPGLLRMQTDLLGMSRP